MNHFELKRSAFDSACAAAPNQVHECYFCLAGKRARLSVVGDSLFHMMEQAFSHLLLYTPSSDMADVSIRLWDAHETGISCPVETPKNPHSLNGHISKNDDGTIISHYRQQIYCTMNRNEKSIIGVCSGAQHMSLFDRGKPLHALIGVWLNDLGTPFLHGGIVARHGRGILLGGSGGSGKSTTALSCLEAGWDYLGDDAIAVEQVDENNFVAHSVYASATLAPDHMHNFSRLISQSIRGFNPGEDKDLVILTHLYPGQMQRSARIKALVIPKVTGNKTPKVYPLKKIDAMLLVAPSSVLYLPNAGAAYLNLLGSIIQSVPCYMLELGGGIGQIPGYMSAILKGLP